MGPQPSERRTRIPAAVRRGQILQAAARLLLEQGHPPLSTEKLAAMVGVSKALVYSHFPDQRSLFDALVQAEFDALDASGFAAAAGQPVLADAALAVANLYFRHVAARGPVLHYVLRDPQAAAGLDRSLAQRRNRMAASLARRLQRELRLPPREAVAAFNLGLVIPEDAGRLVWRGELSLDAGEELCRRLVAAALNALRPTA
jgi:AcrR family transcriptional regulator